MPGRPTTIDATTALPEPAGTPPDDSWTAARGPFWHVVRAGTALGWLLLVAAVLVTGERVTSVEALLAAAAEGDVDEVRVAGEGLPPGARGFVTQEVHWSEGGLHYLARIVQAQPRRAGLRHRTGADRHLVVTTDTAAYLAERTDGVRVVRDGSQTNRLTSGIGPYQVPDAALSGLWLLLLATVVLLVRGPRPRRATRWAWCWLMVGAAPVGVPAFLVLSGPLPLLPRPRPGARVLTGGWAFLLTVLLLRPLLGT
jgi:hypothetical protein